MEKKKLESILELHRKWFHDEKGGKRAYLRGADLRGIYLRGAYLRDANLREAKNADLATAMTSICPEGSIIGWKKCALREIATTTHADETQIHRSCIVKLRIPEDAKRSNATGRRCRASKAEVLAIETLEGEPLDATAYSEHDGDFAYTVGATVEPAQPFDDCRWNECASGIHFYVTRIEAVNHL